MFPLFQVSFDNFYIEKFIEAEVLLTNHNYGKLNLHILYRIAYFSE